VLRSSARFPARGPRTVRRAIGIVGDGSGMFYVVDSGNHAIRTLRCPDE
jgi:hypothetical protein